MNIPTSITGGAQSGLTSPTYTTVVDQAPDTNAKQNAVTVIGGTQSGVDASSVARPFTLALFRPKTFQVLGKPNPTTGVINNVPVNRYKLVVRKGVTPLAGQPSQVASVTVSIDIPAGSDTADPANIKAMLSATIGALDSMSSDLGGAVLTGIL